MGLAVEFGERVFVEEGHGHAPKTSSRSGLCRRSAGGAAAAALQRLVIPCEQLSGSRSARSRFSAAMRTNSGPCEPISPERTARTGAELPANQLYAQRRPRAISRAARQSAFGQRRVGRRCGEIAGVGVGTAGGLAGPTFSSSATRARHSASRAFRSAPDASATDTANWYSSGQLLAGITRRTSQIASPKVGKSASTSARTGSIRSTDQAWGRTGARGRRALAGARQPRSGHRPWQPQARTRPRRGADRAGSRPQADGAAGLGEQVA